ncbi:ABC transporter ATP-binding protein [Mycobacterium sp. pW049]|uniref:ABC transporter ATP-binding protein n=1 Tax=[Mycobacterium] bulgaricum TaxID=3238985 RepID=UPI00351AE7A5
MTALADHDVPTDAVDATPVLDVDGLTVEVRTITGTLRAVDGVSFQARRGETLALLGESGCGKSMTATALVGLLEPVADIVGGTAKLADVDLISADRKKRREMAGTELAIVFQDALTALNPLYTVGTQLAEPFRIHHGLSAKDAKRKAVDLMTRVGIPQPETRLNSYPHQFSGGMRQRLLIAMAVALNPSVLIADEPTTALDVTVQAQIMALLRDLRAEYHMAVVLITHDLALVAEEADRVAIMYAGNIIETGTVAEVFANPKHPYTKGLLNSVPVNARRGDALKSIGGSPPDLHSIPEGCVYQARCPLAADICRTTRPALAAVDTDPIAGSAGSDRKAACHFPEEVSNV